MCCDAAIAHVLKRQWSGEVSLPRGKHHVIGGLEVGSCPFPNGGVCQSHDRGIGAAWPSGCVGQRGWRVQYHLHLCSFSVQGSLVLAGPQRLDWYRPRCKGGQTWRWRSGRLEGVGCCWERSCPRGHHGEHRQKCWELGRGHGRDIVETVAGWRCLVASSEEFALRGFTFAHKAPSRHAGWHGRVWQQPFTSPWRADPTATRLSSAIVKAKAVLSSLGRASANCSSGVSGAGR